MQAGKLSAFGSRSVRRATSRFRVHPAYIVIGGIRCGTTSLISYLADHPQTMKTPKKEVHYFDWNYDRGDAWYRAFFPIRSGRSQPVIAGESSPSYLLDPLVPARTASDLPDVKLIVLLRNPAERAYSHYHLRHGKGMDPAPTFEAALEDEERRMSENAKLGGRRVSNLNCYFHHGRYADGLRRWFDHFDRDRFLVLQSNDLYTDTANLYGEVLRFLGLPPHDLGHYGVHNAAKYDSMEPATRKQLAERYRQPNDELYDLIGRDLGWS